MTLKIGMDVRMIDHSGIGVRIQNILRYMKIQKDVDLYLFGDPVTISKFSIPKGSKVIPYSAKVYSIQEWFGHSKMREMDYLDIPHFNVPLLYLSKCIVTIHDLIPLVMKEFHSSLIKRFYLKLVLNSICTRAFKIITVSQYTQLDFLKYIGSPNNSIETIYNGVNGRLYFPQPEHKIKEFKLKYKLPNTFYLTVGIGKGHKNFDFLIFNLIDLWRKGSIKQDLVLAGAYNMQVELLRNLPDEYKSKVISLPRISDDEMPLMYQSASALLYPSLYEGFGFPVVEAQSVGCPVISSRSSVLPEILSDSALYFDAKSNADFQNILIQWEQNSKRIKKKLIEKGFQNAKRFSWDDSVKKIQHLYAGMTPKS